MDSLPIFTSPKLTAGGVTVRSEDFETPVAARLTIIGESGASLLTLGMVFARAINILG